MRMWVLDAGALPSEEPSSQREAPALGALDALYRAHFADVWRVLRRLGLTPPALDDAVQDVFLVAHRRLPSFEGRSSAKTWLTGIAIRVAQDHRRRTRRKGGLESLPDELPDPMARDPMDRVAAAEAARFLDHFLDRLDQDKREVFVLAELEELSAPEIAALLEVRVNTVYSRLRVARERFEGAIARRRAREERER